MPASLYDFRDFDLMLRLAEIGDADGWASSADLADALGLADELANVAIRCSWMRRYGMLDFDVETRRWRLSDGGLRVTSAKVQASQIEVIERVPDEALVEVMAHVTSRYRLGDRMMATMLRREFLFGTANGKRR